MAFTRSTLARSSSHTNSNIPVFWCYTTADALADVNTADYFLEVIGELAVGDLIYGVTSTGTTNVHAHYLVLSNDGTNIDVSDGVVIAATDTD